MGQLSLLREKKYSGRKTARAISTRGANHVVFKALKPRLRRHHGLVRAVIRDTQDRFGVRIAALALMPDHLHLILKVSSRTQFANALRFLAGQLALRVAGAKLWRARAWSRPITTRRDFENTRLYVCRNPIRPGIWTDADSLFLLNGILQV